jgi:hypothetical protein
LYTLLDAEVLLVVNHTVRQAGLQFSKGPGGPAERVTKSAAKAAEARGKLLSTSAVRRTTRLSMRRAATTVI